MVSIHAPARGATWLQKALTATATVSIHAPARGATINLNEGRVTHECFNPRTREGCDQSGELPHLRAHLVSIHAPARGATLESEWICFPESSFNPRTREGCDLEARQRFLVSKGFNPRTREGCD